MPSVSVSVSASVLTPIKRNCPPEEGRSLLAQGSAAGQVTKSWGTAISAILNLTGLRRFRRPTTHRAARFGRARG